MAIFQSSVLKKYLKQQDQDTLELKAEIDRTDKEIDQLVYELYGLTEEGIGIVEQGCAEFRPIYV
jgi:hypothetical protein